MIGFRSSWTAKVGIVLLLLTACSPSAAPSRSPGSPSQAGILISQIMAGEAGDNNHEFIELANPGQRDANLAGIQLVYRLPSSGSDLPVYTWNRTTWIPAHGHYLLIHGGEDVGTPPDAVFDQPLNLTSGALALRDSQGDILDSVAWGKPIQILGEGTAAVALENGSSLLRAEDAAAGTIANTHDNRDDFALNSAPLARNTASARPSGSGSPAAAFTVTAPASLEPGQTFALSLTIANTGSGALQALAASIRLPDKMTAPNTLPPGIAVTDGELHWSLADLANGQSSAVQIDMTAPWGQGLLAFTNAVVHAGGSPNAAFASPVWTQIVAGPIPVQVSRSLLHQEVTVEGVATITAGSLFAGSGNTKFYLSDPTGGVQIWVPGGGFGLSVPQGSRVRVRGTPQLFRGTVELVAASPEAVEVLAADGSVPAVPSSISQVLAGPAGLAGQLIAISGQLIQSSEGTYSYNLVLSDDQGQTLDIYVDKQTHMTTEGLAVNQAYQVTGILETPNGLPTLYPRIISDFRQLFPAALSIAVKAPATVEPQQAFDIQVTISNHTDASISGVVVRAAVPQGVSQIAPEAGGTLEEGTLSWSIGSLPAGGESVVGFSGMATRSSGEVTIPEFTATSNQLQATSDSTRIFVGGTVPIWAIQGNGEHSPYVLQSQTTEGVVTAVMPGLAGMWIQAIQTDSDAATSDGLFVNTTGMLVPAAPGDLVRIRGEIREISDQTQIVPSSPRDIETLRHGVTLPAASRLDPPADDTEAPTYYEAREGMLVTPGGPAVAVGPTSRYGEYTLVLAAHGVERLMVGSPAGWRITVDDGSNDVHDVATGLPYVVKVGDRLTGVVGPLAYTFGQYKIEPITFPTVVPAPVHLPSLPPADAGSLRVMTWNAENLFDTLPPHPSDPPPPTPDQYRRNLAKVAATIVNAGAPTIVALQEVENIAILKDLAALPVLAPYHYQPYLMEGTDSRGIDVGYLVRADQAQVTQEAQIPVSPDLMSRAPLELDIQSQGMQGLENVMLLNNHFTALTGGIELTLPLRLQQAAVNGQVVEARLRDDPQANVVVLGDLNSFYASPPIQSLIDSGLSDLLDNLLPDERYDYIYQGVAQALDHILVSKHMLACLADFQVLHLDSPFPPPPANDTSPLHKSDHDPLVASFRCFP